MEQGDCSVHRTWGRRQGAGDKNIRQGARTLEKEGVDEDRGMRNEVTRSTGSIEEEHKERGDVDGEVRKERHHTAGRAQSSELS
jgi:hypothetical protein